MRINYQIGDGSRFIASPESIGCTDEELDRLKEMLLPADRVAAIKTATIWAAEALRMTEPAGSC